MAPIRVLICGAAPRKKKGESGWTDISLIRALVDMFLLPGDTVIEGEADGADKLGRQAAEERGGVTVRPFPADWKRYGLGAGPRRNQQMLEEGQPTEVWAFHDDLAQSKGTKDMVQRARRAGLPVTIFSHAHPEGVAYE